MKKCYLAMFGVYKLILTFFFQTYYAANILVVIPYSGKSHYIMQRPIGIELARRGHNVTVITSYKETDFPANYHQVLVSDEKVWNMVEHKSFNFFDLLEKTAEQFQNSLWKAGHAYTESTFQSREAQALMHGNNTFDIIINEVFFQEATNILAHKYNAPLILLSTYGSVVRHHIVTRNPLQLATLPFEFMEIRNLTSFLGRLRNFYFTFYEYFWWRFWFLKKQEELIYKYVPNLSKPVPSLYTIQKNVSLMLMNSHFSFDNVAAFLPNLVEIGGIHLTESAASLPEDMRNILNNSHGVVYVNFGSNIISTHMSKEKKQAFINVFKKLNQTVLWKWEDDSLVKKPNNVFTRKWLPQKEILAHPNIKVFISHGGLLGTHEAAYYGVPIIGVPVFGDQYNNLLLAEEAGMGRILLYRDINEESLESLLRKFISDDTYKKKAMELSLRFRDRPMKPIDTAIYWIEYVIRHKGADFMKNPAIKMNWIAYNMLDVYGFILLVLLLIIYVMYNIVKLITLVKVLPYNKYSIKDLLKSIKTKIH